MNKLHPNIDVPEGIAVDGIALSAYLDQEYGREIRSHMASELLYMNQVSYKPLPASRGKQPLNKTRTKRAIIYTQDQIRRFAVERNPDQLSTMEKVLIFLQEGAIDHFVSAKQVKDTCCSRYGGLTESSVQYQLKLIASNKNLPNWFVTKRKKTSLLLSPTDAFLHAEISDLLKEFVSKNIRKAGMAEPKTGMVTDNSEKAGNPEISDAFKGFMDMLKSYNVKVFNIEFKE